jgi:hypothetical protein
MIQEVSEEEDAMRPVVKSIMKRAKTPNAETKFASIVNSLMGRRDNYSSFK